MPTATDFSAFALYWGMTLLEMRPELRDLERLKAMIVKSVAASMALEDQAIDEQELAAYVQKRLEKRFQELSQTDS